MRKTEIFHEAPIRSILLQIDNLVRHEGRTVEGIWPIVIGEACHGLVVTYDIPEGSVKPRTNGNIIQRRQKHIEGLGVVHFTDETPGYIETEEGRTYHAGTRCRTAHVLCVPLGGEEIQTDRVLIKESADSLQSDRIDAQLVHALKAAIQQRKNAQP